MEVFEVLQNRRQKVGISVAELSRRTGIRYEQLRTSLEGTRGMTGAELVLLSRELGLGIHDFDGVSSLQSSDEPDASKVVA